MMNKVITEGTGQRAQLDFTNVAGKTGTSTGPKDVWFVGFTGKYVGGVWLGNDDNRPMSGGTTGGVFAAPVWHSFMSVVHTDMNIPTIPGLEPHPVQVAEQQRLAAMRPDGAADAPEAQRTSSSLMPDPTRDALRSCASAAQGRRHRRAAAARQPPTSTGANPASQRRPRRPTRRADGTRPASTDHRRTKLGVAQPPLDGTPPRAVPIALSRRIHLGLHRLRKRVSMFIGILGDWAAFLGAVLILGLGTSWYMVDVGTRLTTGTTGRGWRGPPPAAPMPIPIRAPTLPASARCSSRRDRAHLPRVHRQRRHRLHSSCDYCHRGPRAGNHWWSLTVFNDRGELIPNAAQRYAYTSERSRCGPTAASRCAGARASPGNWLPTGGAGRLALMFTTFEGATPMLGKTEEEPKQLPLIRRVQCR